MTPALDEALRGYGQILFCGRRRSGALVWLATMAWPHAGVAGMLGAAGALLAARVLPRRDDLSVHGLYACNGVLAGLGIGVYAATSPAGWVAAFLAGVLAAVLLEWASRALAARHLPTLSVPFVLSAWCVLAVMGAVGLGRDAARVPWTLVPPPLAVGWGVAWSPLHLWDALRVLGAAVFQPGIVPGLLCLSAVWVHSRRLAGIALLAAVAAHAVTASWSVRPDHVPLVALNATVAAMALAGVFLPLRRDGVAVALGAAWIALAAAPLLCPLLDALHLPLLVAPFNAVTIGSLALLQRIRRDHAPVPSPLPSQARVRLTLPFCGRWLVSQGPDGRPTHQGDGRFAWDFVAVDERGRTHRGLGLHAADYYAFGLPVLAPAPGVVALVVDGVPDNVPPRENLEQNWGNLVVLDHGGGEYTEISHFQAHSLVVAMGQAVERGQMLGRCGNSGRSLEPHVHLQVQVAPLPGAATLPARFESFRCFTRTVPNGALDHGDVVEPE